MIVAMVSIPAENKTFKADRCISAFIHGDATPLIWWRWPRCSCAGWGAYADPVAQLGGENHEAAVHRRIDNAAGHAGGLLRRLSVRPNPDTEQRATCRGSSCHRRPERFTDSGGPGE